ncbi:PilZ domain-containing protein [Granulosicoccus sp.]|nr:PilZ domain-containing protein [Granulosicoccus sp.]MDB4222312.1 PilZ domain-containing protein [Granulosicoccus sp.]
MTAEARKGIVLFSITDRGALYSSYLSFVKNGGVFVPTARTYELGDEVFMLLKIMDNTSMMPVKGTVVWVTSAGAQGNKTPGIGVQFGEEDNGQVKQCIDRILSTSVEGKRPTQTM